LDSAKANIVFGRSNWKVY